MNKSVNDIILNGERELKQEEQFLQLSANTTALQDTPQQSYKALGKVGIGAPIPDRQVISAFDSRPVNAIDVNLQLSSWVSVPIGLAPTGVVADYCADMNSTTTGGAYASYSQLIVPKGYVFVARGFTHSFLPDVAIPNLANCFANVLIDNVPTAYNQNIPVGGFSDNTKIFQVVDEGHKFSLSFYINATLFVSVDAQVICYVYGQFLQKSGVPANFEVGGRKRNVNDAIYTPEKK